MEPAAVVRQLQIHIAIQLPKGQPANISKIFGQKILGYLRKVWQKGINGDQIYSQ